MASGVLTLEIEASREINFPMRQASLGNFEEFSMKIDLIWLSFGILMSFTSGKIYKVGEAEDKIKKKEVIYPDSAYCVSACLDKAVNNLGC